MSRIACLRIPKFQIAVHQKREPELKRKAFVLLGDAQKQTDQINLSRARVFMCSDSASKKFVVAGMKWPEARATCANLSWRQCDVKSYREAQKQIVNELVICSPRVSAKEPGIFILDAAGMQRLGGEGKLCRDLLRLVSKLGYTNANVGVADSAFGAMVASRSKNRWYIVPPGRDSEFLNRLPISHLALDSDLQDVFVDLGIKSMGHLAEIPVDNLAERFGREAVNAQQLVLGFDKFQPNIPVLDRKFGASVEIDGPIESLEQTVFLLKSMLDHLQTNLQKEGYCAEELLIRFFNDDELFYERLVKLVRPSYSSKFLLEVLRLTIEAHPLCREFTAIRLEVNRFCKESFQQSKVEIESNANSIVSEQQTNLLQKFLTRLGQNSLVRPLANDQHCLDSSGLWVPVFEANQIDSQIVSTFKNDCSTMKNSVPVETGYIEAKIGKRGLTAGLVLKQIPKAVPVFVEFSDNIPNAIAYHGKWYKILNITVSECLSGLWWEEQFQKSYYVALIEPKYEPGSCMLVLLVRDHMHKNWSIEGIFD
ncbi:MAG: DNA polymerase Y family protein [Candidatus Obscuribacterales bacterium]|nr:DNA polymerase Y family protein [Cyanobacteria bacterium SZAS LIN-5]RTL45111.1 MAG: DNA polymerase Y family protein [Candidatus Melainabacteria bacterium]